MEICDDSRDNNCDGNVDANDLSCQGLCSSAVDCPAPAGESACVIAACNSGYCGGAFAPANTPCNETGGTCNISGVCIVSDPSACVPTPEVCDGIDNDCDNVIDDGMNTGGSCSTGIGQCFNTGAFVCAPGGLVCNAVVIAPTAEVCNGADDDCDGIIDNSSAVNLCPGDLVCSQGACVVQAP
jgi:hypothetical protein